MAVSEQAGHRLTHLPSSTPEGAPHAMTQTYTPDTWQGPRQAASVPDLLANRALHHTHGHTAFPCREVFGVPGVDRPDLGRSGGHWGVGGTSPTSLHSSSRQHPSSAQKWAPPCRASESGPQQNSPVSPDVTLTERSCPSAFWPLGPYALCPC